MGNFVRDHEVYGILVGAINNLGEDASPITSHVNILHNEVSGSGLRGILVFASENIGSLPFPSVGGTARLAQVTVKGNHVHDNEVGISIIINNPGATLDHTNVVGNYDGL